MPAPSPEHSHPAAAGVAGVRWAELAGNWQPIPKRPGYFLGLGTISLGMVILPLLYLALVGGLGLGIWWYFTHMRPHVGSGSGRGAIFMLILWITPGVVAVALLAMLIKPLFAPRARKGEPYTVTPFEEPRLFEFVEAVCRVIGAPPPREIVVDCDINASAFFRSGVLSLFKRGDLTLTIGMPLVAAMSRRQFAGVLAHEFGHFAQGTGMRATYVGASVINWFLRIAFEPDGWDEAIQRSLSRAGDALALLGLVIAICALLTRLLLVLIAMVGIALCAFMLRQMEFDADRYEAQLVGSSACGAITRKLVDLSDVFPKALEQCRAGFQRDKHVPSNLPVVIAEAERRLTREARDELLRQARSRGTGLFDTHPSPKARIAAADKLALPGLYTDESPARGLFTDFDGACKKASFGFFKQILGKYLIDATFVEGVPVALDVRSAGDAGGQVDTRREALARFVGFEVPTWRPLFPSLASVPTVEDGKAVVARLKQARAELKRTSAAAAPMADEYRSASEEMIRMEYGRAIADAGFAIDFKHLGIQRTDRIGLSYGIDRLRTRTAEAAMLVDEAGDAAMTRLGAGLGVLGIVGVEKHLPSAAARRTRADALLAAAGALRELQPWAKAIRESLGKLQALGPSIKKRSDFDKAKAALLRPISDDIRNRLDDSRRSGGAVRDPFAPQGTEANLGQTLVGASPAWREFDDIFNAAELFVDRWADCHRRVMGELCQIAEGVERDLARSAERAKERVS